MFTLRDYGVPYAKTDQTGAMLSTDRLLRPAKSTPVQQLLRLCFKANTLRHIFFIAL
jgi:hypothetical protein